MLLSTEFGSMVYVCCAEARRAEARENAATVFILMIPVDMLMREMLEMLED